jgi:protein-S-isoprenylcysteine O-methyltransferase Ste14
MPSQPAPHADVRIPPPLIYLAFLAGGWLLDRRWPWAIVDRASMLRIAGGILGILVWLALFLAAFGAFRRARTTLVPNRPATAFVTDGPYRFTRNPMYVSLVALYVAGTVFLDSWWPLLLLPVLVLVIDRAVIAREERYLSAAFPVEYDAYRARVRRWL